MDPSRFIAGKLRFQGKLAAVSIAVSFLVMILAVAISAGFRHAVRDGVAAVTGDIQVTSIAASNLSESASIPASLSCGEEILAMPGVEALTPAVFRAGIVKSGDVIHGVLFKGVHYEDGIEENFDGLFVALGSASATDLAKKAGAGFEGSALVLDQDFQTTLPGLFAAGDCTGGTLQVAVAVGEGAKAGLAAIKYIREHRA